MRAGLPLVATSVGGTEEAVEDGATGYLVPRGDADMLRDRIARLLMDPALRTRMGAAGRARFEQHFTLDRMVAKTLSVYGDVVCEVLESRACPIHLAPPGHHGRHRGDLIEAAGSADESERGLGRSCTEAPLLPSY